MDTLINIWNTIIVKTNFFNFLVMAALLWWIFKKVDIINLLENARKKVIASIENSKTEKQSAHEKLKSANKLVANLDSEIEEVLNTARKQGDDLSVNISADTEKRVSSIKANVERVVQSEEKTISAELTGKTAAAAVKTAESHIRNVLKMSPQMHDRYINESIEELDRIEL